MIIDLHVHSREGSDGAWPLAAIFAEATQRGIGFISITDHDSLDAQAQAAALAETLGISYLSGIELNVTISHPACNEGRSFSLDFLGYGFDPADPVLVAKLAALRDHRVQRAEVIFERLNAELHRQGMAPLSPGDLAAIQRQAEGALGRPHIADYLVKQGIVRDRAEAFDKYLVRCDVPKLPLHPEEAAHLIRSAGGRVVLAHANDPNGTSLTAVVPSLEDQLQLLVTVLAPFLDGIECWHPRHDAEATGAYLDYARHRNLIATGGSDCHQDPVLMGSIDVPAWVVEQFF